MAIEIELPDTVRGPRGYGVRSVELIDGDHSPGTLDTYRMTFDNGECVDFQVYNGLDAEIVSEAAQRAIAQMNAAAEAAEARAEAARDTVPGDYTELCDTVTDIRSALNPLFSGLFKIEQGAYVYNDGSKGDYTYWCRTADFVPKGVNVVTNGTIQLVPLAFNAKTGEYIGEWNGSSFSNGAYSAYGKTNLFTWDAWHKEYPNYVFKLNFSIDTNVDITPSDVYSAIIVSYDSPTTDFITQKFVNEENKYLYYSPEGGLIGLRRNSGLELYCTCANGHFFIKGTTNSNRVMRITGTYALASTSTGFTGGYTFLAGHKYKVTSYITRGTRIDTEEQSRPVAVSVYKVGNANSSGTYEEGEKEFSRFVSFDTDTVANIGIYVSANDIYDCEGYVTLQDITEEEKTDVLEYYKEELEDTIEKVRGIDDEPALVFPCVTDIHVYKAATQTFPDMINNIKAFAKAVKCDFLLNTGDTIEGNQQQNVSLGQAYDCIERFKNIGLPLMYVHGNHDNNPYISSGALVFNLKQVYGGFFTATKDVTFNANENGTDYYFDFNGIGVRFISINSCNSAVAANYGFGTSTAAWLANALDTDHLVLLASHVSPIKEHVWNNINPENADDVRTVLSDFTGAGGKLIIITGHSHIDAEFVDPYIEITNVCQKFEQADTSTTEYQKIRGQINGIRDPERTADDLTADAWSAVVLKPISGEIDFIRFGAGIDRYIHYAPTGAGTVTSRLTSPTWHTSNSSVATVSDGVISVAGAGRCAVFAKDADGNMEVWVVEAD